MPKKFYSVSDLSAAEIKAYHEDTRWPEVRSLCLNWGKFGDANALVLKIMDDHGCLKGGVSNS